MKCNNHEATAPHVFKKIDQIRFENVLSFKNFFVCFQAQSGHGAMGTMASLVMVAVMVAELRGLSTNCRALVLCVSSVDHSFPWH